MAMQFAEQRGLLDQTRFLCAAGVMLLAALACSQDPQEPGTAVEAPGPDAQLPVPDLNGSYLFWTPAEQLVGYRNIERIFPTRTIEAGGTPLVLDVSEDPLDLVYEYDGEPWTPDTFMERTNAVGLIVLHDDQIVLELYKKGYGPEQRWTSFSVGKSISSTLVGAAIRDGYIKDVDEPVTTYLPGLAGSGYDDVTIRQVLNMTSGVRWNEDYADPMSDVGRIRSAKADEDKDPIVSYMSQLPRETEPGTTFSYKTGETHLIGSIVRAATGKTLAGYLSEKIWRPLGMEMDAYWMLDTAGNEYAGCCISASLRDFARFGVFFKNGAAIDGTKIVPDDWIAKATTPSSASDRYGYQWWLTEGDAFYAVGIFGQQIWIDPQRDLVIVIQSANKTATDREAGAARSALVAAVSNRLSR